MERDLLMLSFIIKNYKRENEIKNFAEMQKLLQQIRQVITSHDPISLMKAYFSIIDNISEWNNVLPPLKKIENPPPFIIIIIRHHIIIS